MGGLQHKGEERVQGGTSLPAWEHDRTDSAQLCAGLRDWFGADGWLRLVTRSQHEPRGQEKERSLTHSVSNRVAAQSSTSALMDRLQALSTRRPACVPLR